MALQCPEPASNYKSKTYLNHPRYNRKPLAFSQRDGKRSYSFSTTSPYTDKSDNNLDGLNILLINTALAPPENWNTLTKIEYNTNLFATTNNSLIPVEEYMSNTLTSGDEVADFGNNDAMYKIADISPTNSNSNPGMNFFNYSDMKLGFSTMSTSANTQEGTIAPQKMNWMAMAGFIAGAIGFSTMFFLFGISQSFAMFLVGLLLAVGGIVLSRLALRKIRENPAKFRGKNWQRLVLRSELYF